MLNGYVEICGLIHHSSLYVVERLKWISWDLKNMKRIYANFNDPGFLGFHSRMTRDWGRAYKNVTWRYEIAGLLVRENHFVNLWQLNRKWEISEWRVEYLSVSWCFDGLCLKSSSIVSRMISGSENRSHTIGIELDKKLFKDGKNSFLKQVLHEKWFVGKISWTDRYSQNSVSQFLHSTLFQITS